MDGGSQIHGWLASRPAGLKRRKRDASGGSGWMARRFFFENLAGRLASPHVCGAAPSILGVYHCYWYLIEYFDYYKQV